MDSREGAPPPPRQHQHSMAYSAGLGTNHHHSMMIPNYAQFMQSSASGFQFNSPPPPQRPPQEAMNMVVYDGSSPPPPRPQEAIGRFENVRKKRGRPRKYVPDGSTDLGLAPAPPQPSPSTASASASAPPNTDNPKRNRGRPPGSGKKQLDALGGTGGLGFTPHVIKVEVGEDIVQKINAFSLQSPRAICILSAIGAICNITLRQSSVPSNVHGLSRTHEGCFEIISLTGSFLVSNTDDRKRDSCLSLSMSGSEGHVVGGIVCGALVAASPVQVIVGSFVEGGNKTSANGSKHTSSSAPPPQMLTFNGAAAASSPPSHGGSSDSSGENNSNQLDRGPGQYNSANQQIQNFQLYQQLWVGQTQQ